MPLQHTPPATRGLNSEIQPHLGSLSTEDGRASGDAAMQQAATMQSNPSSDATPENSGESHLNPTQSSSGLHPPNTDNRELPQSVDPATRKEFTVKRKQRGSWRSKLSKLCSQLEAKTSTAGSPDQLRTTIKTIEPLLRDYGATLKKLDEDLLILTYEVFPNQEDAELETQMYYECLASSTLAKANERLEKWEEEEDDDNHSQANSQILDDNQLTHAATVSCSAGANPMRHAASYQQSTQSASHTWLRSSDQMRHPNQLDDHPPGQLPGHPPGQMPGHLPGQLHPQLPNQGQGQPQGQQPMIVVQAPRASTPPRFFGDIRAFRQWWQLFKLYIHDQPLSPIEKFKSLHDSLGGQAAITIRHLDFTPEHYNIAVQLIHDQFGKSETAQEVHLNDFDRACASTDLRSPGNFNAFVTKVTVSVQGLIALGNTYGNLSTPFAHKLMHSIPKHYKERFLRERQLNAFPDNRQTELESLLIFLKREAQIVGADMHRNQNTQNRAGPSGRQQQRKSNYDQQQRFNAPNVNKNSSFLNPVRSDRSDPECIFCTKKHFSGKCRKSMSVEARRQMLQQANACPHCLRLGHPAKKCRNKPKCSICTGSHYPILCPKNNANNNANANANLTDDPEKKAALNTITQNISNSDTSQTVQSLSTKHNTETLLPTGLVWVKKGDSRRLTRVLLDSGSQKSYVSAAVAEWLGQDPSHTESIITYTIGGGVSTVQKYPVRNITLESRFNAADTVSISCLQTKVITSGILPTSRDSFGLTPIADHMKGRKPENIDVLIGSDHLAAVTGTDTRVFNKIIANHTLFGWILHGIDGAENNTASAAISLGVFQTVHAFTAITNTGSTTDAPLHEQTAGDSLARNIEFLWEAETADFTSAQLSEEDQALIEHFNSTTTRDEEGRYTVSLPFKEDIQSLSDNEKIARSRLMHLLRKRSTNKPLLAAIDKEVSDCLAKGYIEPATQRRSGEPAHYLPILAIVKSTKLSTTDEMEVNDAHIPPPSTSVRLVKDAGTRQINKSSLNDVLHQGPNLLPDMVKILIHFRSSPIAIVADIERAFHQFRVNPDHRTFLRFFWPLGISGNPNAPIREFQGKSLDFGLVCSPFLHILGLKKHLQSESVKHPEHAKFIQEISDTFYMDDIVTGSSDPVTAKERSALLIDIFSSGHFTLKKWATNSPELGEWLNDNLPATAKISFEDEQHKLLGVRWNQLSDSIGVFLQNAIECLQSNPPSKRTLLRALAQIFDPLGILSPVAISAKMLLQSLWRAQLDWDAQLADEYLSKLTAFQAALAQLHSVEIPRAVRRRGDNVARRELHVFCDASLSAYGCIVYLRTTHGSGDTTVDFLFAKGRVTPLKGEWNIHRLELLGATLAAQIHHKLEAFISPPPDSSTFWSDNAAVLGWIRDKPQRWKPFVANRIKKIQSLSDASRWHYVSSENNPADLISRGAPLDNQASRDLWLQGPTWLKEGQPPETHTLNEQQASNSDTDAERRTTTTTVAAMVGASAPTINIDASRFSSWTKLIRTTAYVRRILEYRREDSLTISASEYQKAEEFLIKFIQAKYFAAEIKVKCQALPKSSSIAQFRPFIGQDGFVRCRTRLEKAKDISHDEKFPILLPGEDDAVKLLIAWTHANICLHAGGVAHTLHHLRTKYFVIHARKTVKKVISRCITCIKFTAQPAAEEVPPLPPFRVEQATPFVSTGTDFAGPIAVKNDNGVRCKSYIVIFVCAVTRAIHLELVPDLTTYEFLMALRRFMNRRPYVQKIISDNARSFGRAAKELKLIFDHIRGSEVQQLLADSKVTWEFITERAPQHGAWWERLVQSTKRPLRKILGTNCVHYRVLETILTDIEAMVNQRPLTTVTTDINEIRALSPADILYGHAARHPLPQTSQFPVDVQVDRPTVASARWKHQQTMLNAYWKRFRGEYQNYLRHLHSHPRIQRRPLRVGDVCLLQDSSHPSRAFWPLCRIINLSGGERTDLRKRSCMIKMATGQVWKRPIQQLYRLELSA